MRFWPLLPLVLVGCGHPATVEDCEAIVERIARLELEKRNPGQPEAVEREVQKTKDAVRQATMSQCVGKRITRSALECVRDARTSEQVVNECFNGWK
jgi:hypothetical protein